MRNYDDNVMGQVTSNIFAHHSETDTCYTLTEDAKKLFEAITDKYNGQFNLKYSIPNQIFAFQPELDLEEKSEICVRTKATELIGHLMCVLWMYCNGKNIPFFEYFT